jgi:cysteinyl-tRNA synthetase
LQTARTKSEKIREDKIKNYKDKFSKEISDDLNLPNAFTVLFHVIKDDTLNNSEKIVIIEDFDTVFSLQLVNKADEENNDADDKWIQQLISERNDARGNKDWKRADEIRETLLKNNIELIDSKEGTTWKHK